MMIVRNGFLALIACVVGSAAAFAADTEDLAAAREFFVLRSDLRGYERPAGDMLETASRNLVARCAHMPLSQMSRTMLQGCEEFDGYKRVRERERRRKLDSR